MSELKFKFKMPDDESLAGYISVKGEKGEKGDPTKLSQLENDTDFVAANTTALTNYYTKAQTDSAIDADVEALETELGVPDGFFADTGKTVSGEGSSITLNGTANAVFKDIKLYGDTEQTGTPTPSNPVDVQVVTGNQTIIISDGGQQSQSYTLSLGNLELCRMGSSRDYAFKSGSTWYKHSEVGKVTLNGSSSELWTKSNSQANNLYIHDIPVMMNPSVLLCDEFGNKTASELYNNNSVGICYNFTSTNLPSVRIGVGLSGASSVAGFKSWLSENPATVYYQLATSVEEEITDETLVAQLESLTEANSYNGTTVIICSGTLSASLSVVAYTNNWNGTVAGVNNEIAQIKTDISEAESSIDAHEARITANESSIANHEIRITANEQSIASLESAKNGLIAVSREQGTSDYWVMYSPDGEHFYQCGEMLPNGIGRDASSLTEIGGRYYYVYSGGYRITTDFKNWSQAYTIANDQTGTRSVWANTLYYDEENEVVYIYSAYQYNDDEIMPDVGAVTHYFKIVYQTATINSDGTLNIDATTHDLVYDEGESYIDPYVSMDYNLGLVIAYKDELRTTILTRTMNTPTSINNDAIETPVTGIEAPQLVSTPLGTICYFDGYMIGGKVVTAEGTQGAANCCGFFYISNRNSWFNHQSRGVVPIKTSCPLRHPGIMECSDKALALVQQLGVHPYPTSGSKSVSSSLRDGMKNVAAKDGELVVNLQGLCYIMNGTKTVTIKPELRQEPFRFFFYKGATITWSEDSNVQSFMKGGTFTADHDQWMTLYPDARDMVGGLFVPIDRS